MSDKKDFVKWVVVFVLVSGMFLVSVAIQAYCQRRHSQQHIALSETMKNIRINVVLVTEKTTNEIHWKQTDDYLTTIGSYLYDSDTLFPDNYKDGNCYLVYYCEVHNMAYTLKEVGCKDFHLKE